MKKILAIGGSNSKASINKIFAQHIAGKVNGVEVISLDWKDMVLPLYGPDVEAEIGVPEKVQAFLGLINDSDAIVLSLAEYNGLTTTAFKNLWDWTSRLEKKFWADKPMFLAATSPGGRGAENVLSVIKNLIPHYGGNVITDFSLPNFYDNFKDGELINKEIEEDLNKKIAEFTKVVEK